MNSPSQLVLGCAQLGLHYGIANKEGQPSLETARNIISQAWEHGVREFDTAQAYGTSETVLGEVLHDLGLSNQARIISKLNPSLDCQNQADLQRSVEESLHNLRIRRLSGLLLHNERGLDFWERGLSDTFKQLIEKGYVERAGVSVYHPDQALRTLEISGIDIIQVPTNCFDRRFIDAGIFQLAHQKKKEVYVRSILLQGLLTFEPDKLPTHMTFCRPALENFSRLGQELGMTRVEMAFDFLKLEATNSHIIFGAETPSQVTENMSIWKKAPLPLLAEQIRKWIPMPDETMLNPNLWVTGQ